MIATTIEQSRELLKLGLSPESADMIYWKMPEDEYYEHENIIWLDSVNTLRRKGLVGFDEAKMEIIPAWSLTALLELIPNYQLQTRDKGVGILFGSKKVLKEIGGKTPIDAAYDMVVWLLENGHIKTEKI